MPKDRSAFGNYLREMIKKANMSQTAFYTAVEITRPYFYDILSGKANPPPPEMQYKMLKHLNPTEEEQRKFLNLAAQGRNEIPADIAQLILEYQDDLDKIRETLNTLLNNT